MIMIGLHIAHVPQEATFRFKKKSVSVQKITKVFHALLLFETLPTILPHAHVVLYLTKGTQKCYSE
jgi:hypothetical protein